jgi:transposase
VSKAYKEVKIKILARALGKDPVSVIKLSREYGISVSTIYSWIKATTDLQEVKMDKVKRPKEWSAEERLQVVNDTHHMSPKDIGEYCREKGLYTYNIEEFKKDFICMGTPTLRESLLQKELKEAREARKEAEAALLVKERDALRKDSALAEITALLVMKKKADLIWGAIEDAQ